MPAQPAVEQQPAVQQQPAVPAQPAVEQQPAVQHQPVVDAEPRGAVDTIVLRLGGTRYAVEMDVVAEVGRPPAVTRVPGVPAWLSGVANWRGRILPVVDLRPLVGAAQDGVSKAGRIVVVTRDGMTLALLTERVEGVVTLAMDRLEPVLHTLPGAVAALLVGQVTDVGGPIALLDLGTVFGLRSQLPRVRRTA